MPDTRPSTPTTPEALAHLWIEAKAHEDSAKAYRIQVEEQLVKLIAAPHGYEGTQKPIPGFAIQYAINRAVDTAALTAGWAALSPQAQSCFRWKFELAKKEFDSAAAMAPAVFNEVAAFVTSKPAKPSFKFEQPKEPT